MAEIDDREPFARAASANPEEPELSGKCAGKVRGHPLTFNVSCKLGDFEVPYHGLCGLQGIAGGFRLAFRATYLWEQEGELKNIEGVWALTVKGERLEPVRHYLRVGQLVLLLEGGSPHLKEPCITSIRLEPVETVGFEPPQP